MQAMFDCQGRASYLHSDHKLWLSSDQAHAACPPIRAAAQPVHPSCEDSCVRELSCAPWVVA